MAKEHHRITSGDVARASGVSRATVSYVLNNDPRQSIPAETRERVLQAARELGYRPFAPARILRAGYSRIVLAVLPFEQVDPGNARDLRDLEEGLAERGYSLIWHVGVPNAAYIHPSANLTPAVIAAFTSRDDPVLAEFLNDFNVPVVWMREAEHGRAIGRLQVEYLAAKGWPRVVFAAPDRADVQRLAQQRLAGVRERCAELGWPVPPTQVIPLQREGARAALTSLLEREPAPFGLCCYNDEVACAALAGLADRGIAVPGQVAVIGCDDIPLAQLSTPGLTTIAPAPEDRATLLAARVATIIAASVGEPLQEYPPQRLVVIERQSA